jgi:hypothetical protein
MGLSKKGGFYHDKSINLHESEVKGLRLEKQKDVT